MRLPSGVGTNARSRVSESRKPVFVARDSWSISRSGCGSFSAILWSHWSVVLPEIVNPSLIALPSGTCNVSARDFTRITIQYDEVCLQVNKLWDIPAAKPTSQFGMVWMRGQGRVYRVRPLKSGEIWGKLPTGFQLHRPQVRTLDEASQTSQAALSAWLNKPP